MSHPNANHPAHCSGLPLSTLLGTLLCSLCLALMSPGRAHADPFVWTRANELPSPQDHHAAIYDPVRNRLWLSGGAKPSISQPSPEIWALSLDGTPRWHFEGNGGFLQRYNHTALYDATADQVVVYGGEISGTPLSDVWRQTLPSGAGQSFGSGTPPPAPTFGWAARRRVLDTLRRRMLVVDDAGVVNALDIATGNWSALATSGTPAFGTTGPTAYDAARDRLMCYEGTNGLRVLTLAGTPTWSLLPTTGAPTTSEAILGLVHDAARDRALIAGAFGGVWAMPLSGPAQWTKLSAPPFPPGNRSDVPVVHDTQGDRLLISGGVGFNDTWGFNLQTNLWSLVHPGGTIPAMTGHSAIVVPAMDAMLAFGLSVPWSFPLDGLAPTPLTVTGTGPAATTSQAAILDPLRQRAVVFTNKNVVGQLPVVYTLSLTGTPTWATISTLGTPPSPRTGAQAVYDPVHDRMIVFGDFGPGNVPLLDVWALPLSGSPTWVRLTDGTGMPAGSYGVRIVLDSRRDRLVATGASGSDGFTHGWTFPLDGSSASWSSAAGGLFIGETFYHAAAYDSLSDRVILHGGLTANGSTMISGLAALKLSPAEEWQSFSADGGPPSDRWNHPLVRDAAHHRFITYGGSSGPYGFASALNSVWMLTDAGALLGVQPGGRTPTALALSRARLVAPDRIAASFQVATDGDVTLDVLDLQGRRLGSTRMSAVGAGAHEATIALPRALAPGLWLVVARQGEQRASRKLVVVR